MRLQLELLLHGVVRAGRFGDIQPALVIERCDNRPLDERTPRGKFNRKPVGHLRKRRRIRGVVCSKNRCGKECCKEPDGKQGPNRHAATPTMLCYGSLEYNLAMLRIQPLRFSSRIVSRNGAKARSVNLQLIASFA